MTKPSLNLDVSVGNVVSWLVLLLGLAVSYGKMQEVQAANKRENEDIKSRYERLVTSIAEDNKSFAKDLNELKVDVAVVKTTVLNLKSE